MNSRRRRLAFVDARYHSFYGAQRSLYTLVTNLTSFGVEPLVLLPAEGMLAEQYRKAGIDVHILPLGERANRFGGEIPRMSWLGKLGVIAALGKYNLMVARWLRKYDIQVVYANDLRAVLYVGFASKINRVPLIWYVRVDGRPNILSRIGVRLADRVILIAEGVRNLFSTRDYERFRDKFRVLYTGFDLADENFEEDVSRRVRSNLGIPVNATVIGIVSSITPRKGHDLLIKALSLLRKERDDLHLLIVGGTPVGHEDFRAKLEQQIEKAHLGARVHWVGYQANVTDYYQAMDLLVLPSRSEGLPRTIIEALGMGVPVVATDVGGVREILVSEKLGRVVPPDNVASLSDAIMGVIESADFLSEAHRIERRNYVRERFSVQAYVRGFLSIVDEIT